jgi:hypothetical protein
MGVTVRINGYEKDADSIVGRIKCLGYYEVNLESIEKHRLRKSPVQFWGDILLITETARMRWLNDFELSRNNFIFYDLASCYFSGQSLRQENGESIGLMFEPESILVTITKLLDASEMLIKNFDNSVQKEIKERDEVNRLMDFKVLLEETVAKGWMIGIVIG